MSYDLWRLRVNGLVRRVRTHRWELTPEGVQTGALSHEELPPPDRREKSTTSAPKGL
jgi:hypothetical protein